MDTTPSTSRSAATRQLSGAPAWSPAANPQARDAKPVNLPRPAPHAEATLAWTNWPLFTVGMVQRGFKDDDIRKILGESMLRVARANFDG